MESGGGVTSSRFLAAAFPEASLSEAIFSEVKNVR